MAALVLTIGQMGERCSCKAVSLSVIEPADASPAASAAVRIATSHGAALGRSPKPPTASFRSLIVDLRITRFANGEAPHRGPSPWET